MATSSILGQYENSLNRQAGTDRVATDKDTFLKLLIAQLTHQDPLNPVEDKEFIAQLAQFTQVEKLENIDQGVRDLNEGFLKQQVTGLSGLIGTDIMAQGDSIYISNVTGANPDKDSTSTPIRVKFPTDVSESTFNVYTSNEDGSIGRIVYSAKMGPQYEGEADWQWPGRDNNGNAMPDGRYIVNITAKDKNGNDVLATTRSIGTVAYIETQADGNHKLQLADGRVVKFNDIEVIAPYGLLTQIQGGGKEEEEEDGGGSGTGGGGTAGENGGTGGSTGETGGTGGTTGETGGTGGSAGETP